MNLLNGLKCSVFMLLMCFALCVNGVNARRATVDLAGEWKFSTSLADDSAITVKLPGTTDTNGVGVINDNHGETTQLTRRTTFSGKAYYSRSVDIPTDWKGRHITLMLERTRPSEVWVDGVKIGSCRYLSTPHRYDLSEALSPGRHIITVMVDNGDAIPEQIKSSSHACTESTQTNWNGIIGRIELQSVNPLHVSSLSAWPDVDSRSFKIVADLSRDKSLNGKSMTIGVGDRSVTLPLRDGVTRYEAVVALGDTARLWSEWTPVRHIVTAVIPGIDSASVKAGLRDFKAKGRQMSINDTVTFLRGRHDACVWPLTAHVAMDVDSWRDYFRTIKDYGLNHVRFHSWCPPDACFEAADMEGIYLQPELPIWGVFSKDSEELMQFLLEDGKRIHEEYGNHPSFVMFALGNELWGEIPVMSEFIETFRGIDSRHLYAYGSNVYLGYNGHIDGEDFMVTCRVGGGDGYSTHTRASFSFYDADEGGYLNNTPPNTVMNFQKAVELSPVPVVGHETGQYQIYPDYAEMSKYTGVLRPDNFAEFKRRLEAARMGGQALDFHRASGAWAVELYRADIEMNLRTPDMAGFQLLDLQDYPGQGTALVGVLDAFMDNKGLVSPEEWRRWCDEVVLLAEMPRYTYNEGEMLEVDLAVADYGNCALAGDTLVWKLCHGDVTVENGRMIIPEGRGLLDVGRINVPLATRTKARRMDLKLELAGSDITNSYPLWVYPAGGELSAGDVIIASSLSDDVTKALRDGARVLLAPSRSIVDSTTVGGLFMTDYWNYRMFKTISESNNRPVSPGTMGLLIDASHPALAQFPTDYHTSWQWYGIVKNSYPLILDALNDTDYRPLVQVIDNVERNHRLGLVMEFNVDKGKLLLVMADIDKALSTREGRQLLNSLVGYMNSDAFSPDATLSLKQLEELLTVPASSLRIDALHNISYD